MLASKMLVAVSSLLSLYFLSSEYMFNVFNEDSIRMGCVSLNLEFPPTFKSIVDCAIP